MERETRPPLIAIVSIIVLLVVAVVAVAVFIAAMVGEPAKAKPQTTPQPFQKITETITIGNCCRYVYVVKDMENNIEYIVVENGPGISITPRIKKEQQ